MNTSRSDTRNSNEREYWEKKKKLLKQKYPFLTEQELDFKEGMETVMIESLAYELGISKEELIEVLENL